MGVKRMNISKSRTSTKSIMANGYFGDLKITNKNGDVEIIPRQFIDENGKIKDCYYDIKRKKEEVEKHAI